MDLFEMGVENPKLSLFDGAAVLLTVARHDRDFMYCEERVGAKGEVYYDVAGYKYRADWSPLPQLPRAPEILDVVDLYEAGYRQADIA